MSINKYQDKNGDTFYKVRISRWTKNPPKVRKFLYKDKIKTMKHAITIEKRLTIELFQKVEKIDGLGFTWREVIEKWYEYKKVDTFNKIGKSALTDYYRALHKWTSHLLDTPAKEIKRGDIMKIITTLDDAGRSKSFQDKMKGTISRVFTWAIDEKVLSGITEPPTYGIKTRRKEEVIPTILNMSEISKLLHSAKELNSKWYPIWATALLTGCRNGELFALTWDDVDFDKNLIKVSKSYNRREKRTKSTKAGYFRNIPMNGELKDLFLELKNSGHSDTFVLPRIREWCMGEQAKELRTFCVSIEITSIKFHDLRACFATQLLQNKVSPATVMKICGWKELDTMGRYIRMAGIDEMGATDSLKLLPEVEAMGKVVSLSDGRS